MLDFIQFDQEPAKAINKARLDHLASLGLKLENSIVLEVASGIGLLTGFFESLGCTVLSTEARQSNIEEHRRRYPHRRVEFADLTEPGSHNHFGEFDIVFCYGTLYHLSNPALAIKDIAKVCKNLLLLETCVYPIDNGDVNHIEEPQSIINQSVEGIGCRPARNWIFYELRKYFPYVYVTASQPDHPDFPLNWPVLNADRLTRAVFVASRTPLDLPTLLHDLPVKQYKMSSLKKSEESNFNNLIEGILFDDFRVSIDPKATKVGGSWQGTPRNGIPTTGETVNREIHFDGKEKFREWIKKFSTIQNRLYLRDQTPESLKALVDFVHRYGPTKIIELGTHSGLSLRTWLSSDTQAEIIAIDLSFGHLYESQKIVPIDLSRVKLIEQNALQMDFSQLWQADDKVLFYVDAHDLPNVSIMKHFLDNAVPALPPGSVVIVDDLWYSPTTLTNNNALNFFEKTVLNEIDTLQCFDGFYAPYWKGGSFFGFLEVIPLMEWINRNQVNLIFKQGVKSVTFTLPFERGEKK